MGEEEAVMYPIVYTWWVEQVLRATEAEERNELPIDMVPAVPAWDRLVIGIPARTASGRDNVVRIPFMRHIRATHVVVAERTETYVCIWAVVPVTSLRDMYTGDPVTSDADTLPWLVSIGDYVRGVGGSTVSATPGVGCRWKHRRRPGLQESEEIIGGAGLAMAAAAMCKIAQTVADVCAGSTPPHAHVHPGSVVADLAQQQQQQPILDALRTACDPRLVTPLRSRVDEEDGVQRLPPSCPDHCPAYARVLAMQTHAHPHIAAAAAESAAWIAGCAAEAAQGLGAANAFAAAMHVQDYPPTPGVATVAASRMPAAAARMLPSWHAWLGAMVRDVYYPLTGHMIQTQYCRLSTGMTVERDTDEATCLCEALCPAYHGSPEDVVRVAGTADVLVFAVDARSGVAALLAAALSRRGGSNNDEAVSAPPVAVPADQRRRHHHRHGHRRQFHEEEEAVITAAVCVGMSIHHRMRHPRLPCLAQTNGASLVLVPATLVALVAAERGRVWFHTALAHIAQAVPALYGHGMNSECTCFVLEGDSDLCHACHHATKPRDVVEADVVDSSNSAALVTVDTARDVYGAAAWNATTGGRAHVLRKLISACASALARQQCVAEEEQQQQQQPPDTPQTATSTCVDMDSRADGATDCSAAPPPAARDDTEDARMLAFLRGIIPSLSSSTSAASAPMAEFGDRSYMPLAAAATSSSSSASSARMASALPGLADIERAGWDIAAVRHALPPCIAAVVDECTRGPARHPKYAERIQIVPLLLAVDGLSARADGLLETWRKLHLHHENAATRAAVVAVPDAFRKSAEYGVPFIKGIMQRGMRAGCMHAISSGLCPFAPLRGFCSDPGSAASRQAGELPPAADIEDIAARTAAMYQRGGTVVAARAAQFQAEINALATDRILQTNVSKPPRTASAANAQNTLVCRRACARCLDAVAPRAADGSEPYFAFATPYAVYNRLYSAWKRNGGGGGGEINKK